MTIAKAFVVSAALVMTMSAPSGVRGQSRAPTDQLSGRLPRVEYQGGPFIRRPRIVTITFAGDDPHLVAHLERFGDRVTRTSWWRAVTDGYCVSGDCIGEGRDGVHVRVDTVLPPKTRAVDVATLLTREIAAGRVPVDEDTVLLVYLPQGVALSDALVTGYCGEGPRAFHRALRLETGPVPYAVIPRCVQGRAITAIASHELLEAVTNPDPSFRGFAFTRRPETSGFAAAGLEPVDACGLLTLDRHHVREGEFVLQRAWSNRAASAGEDPCVPAAGRAYRALVPAEPRVRLTHRDQSIAVRLTAVADPDTEPWSVRAVDLTGRVSQEACTDVSLDTGTVAPGDGVTLRVTLRAPPSRGSCVIGLVSEGGTDTTLWPLMVVTR